MRIEELYVETGEKFMLNGKTYAFNRTSAEVFNASVDDLNFAGEIRLFNHENMVKTLSLQDVCQAIITLREDQRVARNKNKVKSFVFSITIILLGLLFQHFYVLATPPESLVWELHPAMGALYFIAIPSATVFISALALVKLYGYLQNNISVSIAVLLLFLAINMASQAYLVAGTGSVNMSFLNVMFNGLYLLGTWVSLICTLVGGFFWWLKKS